MNTITTEELEFESVELLPERAALGDIGWSPIGIYAVNQAIALNAGGWHNTTSAVAGQWIAAGHTAHH